MLDSFIGLYENFPYALLCGCVVALSCSFLGIFVLLKRMTFISVALSECSACGIALASVIGFSPMLGSILLCLLAVNLLALDWERKPIPQDAVLGGVFVGASALSVLLVSHSGIGMLEVKALLYGDLLLASDSDLYALVAVHLPILILGLIFLKQLIYVFFDREFSLIMKLPVKITEISFFIVLAVAIATASKSCGALLVFCYLSVIPAIAMLLSKKLGKVVIIGAISGLLATVGGLTLSFHYDLPGNQCIIVLACILLVLALLLSKNFKS